ncbi:MAG TPA: MATE family efflux transporter [Anaerohalosphaeraceae bacterium]|nr:MATE family efflux transporter [Phycisphaerae bacterium]HOK96697.1 MATE family efflux transporter [Anaerohalosphaeraceae bacterium]HOL32299.1 MATE family efflux transporter [Anaerohalosphaeraceae bacterium]HPC64234.1 MATE family efflux transporter [Anaerohalosphaeraceae bacterium]HPO69338.1 MATE family efflux transporter [Anaerohalosphaeraceae bacterium]
MQIKINLDNHLAGPGGIREMIAIALPMVISSACETTMTFTDRLFLSRLGPEYMSAAMAGGLTSFVMMTFVLGLTGYTTALAAQYWGANQKKRCPVAVTQALILSLLAYPVIVAARPLAFWLFDVIKVPSEQLMYQQQYFNILLNGVLIGLLRNCLSSFFSGIGKTRVVMVSALTSMAVNVGANYLLIFGKWGIPPLGIRGAAYGTLIGGFCGLMVLAAVYLGSSVRREYSVAASFRWDSDTMKKLLRFGYPAGLEFFLNLLAFNLLVMILHSHSAVTAAAITIVFNWDMVSFVPMIGINVGVTSLVGRYMGAGLPDTAHRATLSGLKLAWMYSSCILLMFAFFPDCLVGLFRPRHETALFAAAYPMAVTMLRMAALYVMADAVMLVFGGALRGAGDTFWAMCISVVLHWILVALLFVFVRMWDVPPAASWLTLCCTFMLLSMLFYLRYRQGKWRTLRLIGQEFSPPAAVNGFRETKDL